MKNMNKPEVDAKRLGEQIRLLRRRRHLTQAALAQKVGIRTGPMNYLEKGHHLPSLPVITKLAEVLGVTLDCLVAGECPKYLVQESGETYGSAHSESIWMAESRDYAADRASIVRIDPYRVVLDDASRERLEDLIRVFLALEDLCGVQKQASIPLDIRLPARESHFERYVENIRHLFGVSHAVIFDYLELFENAGLRVLFLRLPPEVKSLSCYDRLNRNVFLFIREDATVEHKLFRLCYELGRIYLFNGGLAAGKIGALDGEHAARRFASLFLMPEQAVTTTVQQLGIEPNEWNWDMLMRIKHRFGVSAEAFLYRLQELSLITQSTRDRLKAEIYAWYKQQDYAEPDSSRRILTPNGRLGDLLLSAAIKVPDNTELAEIRQTLKALKVKMP